MALERPWAGVRLSIFFCMVGFGRITVVGLGSRGGTPRELAGEDACGTRLGFMFPWGEWRRRVFQATRGRRVQSCYSCGTRCYRRIVRGRARGNLWEAWEAWDLWGGPLLQSPRKKISPLAFCAMGLQFNTFSPRNENRCRHPDRRKTPGRSILALEG